MEVEVLGDRVRLDEDVLDAAPDGVRRQVAAYAAGDEFAFDVRVRYPDSFTGRVMRVMARIPYGETRTYGDLADDLDTAAIAVGQACGRNPVPIVVPCHRVVAADGVGGYGAGSGVPLKRRLLALERTQ